MRQATLFDDDGGRLAGLVPALRAAMNRAADASPEGRDLLLDRINALARSAGVRLTAGNAKAVSRDTLDKWLNPADRDHTPGILAVAAFCLAAGDFGALRVVARALGLDLMTAEDRKLRDYGRACLAEREARKQKKMLEDSL